MTDRIRHRTRLWVLPSLARHSYAHGRRLGGKFDFMATNPGRVGMFERIGYVRYTDTPIRAHGVGLLLPMILPATDHAFLRSIRSPCLAAAVLFPDEPQWREWLIASRPIIDLYYSAERRREIREKLLVQQSALPAHAAEELDALCFVHHFTAGTTLQRIGDRVRVPGIRRQARHGACGRTIVTTPRARRHHSGRHRDPLRDGRCRVVRADVRNLARTATSLPRPTA